MWGPAVLTIISFMLESAACTGVTVVGGKEVKPHSNPWMASIQQEGRHVCGGTLIHEQWVLTAAHCREFFAQSLKGVKVVLGAHSLSKAGKEAVSVGITKCEILPSYKRNTKVGDLMLLKLQEKAKGKKVKVKVLPKSGQDILVGTRCLVTGWGTTKPSSKSPSDTLQGAEVMVVDRELCNCLYNNSPIITEDMLCTRNKETGADACKGDSGGPLLCKNAVVGVVEGGAGCGNPKKPGVYTRLTKPFLSWIRKITKEKSNSTESALFYR